MLDTQLINTNSSVNKIKKNRKLPGAGFMVFRTGKSDTLQVLLIKSKKNIYGFPKGCQEPNESIIETAFRELKEESGIEETFINHLDIYPFKECKRKLCKETNEIYSKLNYYFIGILQNSYYNVSLIPDINEISGIGWYELKDAQHLLESDRYSILESAIDVVFN
jgi:8-oxo-dGTP pyrophosphatase MutT (NUDIX family)